jgi:hypothetical protein
MDFFFTQVDNPQLRPIDKKSSNMFEEYLASTSCATASSSQPINDELGVYLRAGPESLKYKENGKEKVMMPIEWWVRHADTYPRLSRMALDYLSIPGKRFITSSAA